MTSRTTTRLHAAALGCATLFAMASASAAVPGSSPEANYQKERATCLSGASQEARATCLREAGAALVEARRGGLTTPTPKQMAFNAELRCQAQPSAEDRDACKRMIRGQGSQDGSVAQGAVVRELSTVEVAPAAGLAAPAPARQPVR